MENQSPQQDQSSQRNQSLQPTQSPPPSQPTQSNQPIQPERPVDPTPGNKKSPKPKWIIISCIIGTLVAIIATIVVVVILQPDDTGEEPGLEIEKVLVTHPDTPTLQLYSVLPETATIANLREYANQVNPAAIITINDDGSGYLQLPETEEMIIFSHELTDFQETVTDDEGFVTNAITEYDITTPVSSIRYVHPAGDSSYTIGYDEETNAYDVFDLTEVITLPTKQEAIEFYKNPTR